MTDAAQPGLFDAHGSADPTEAVAARARMRGMIERLRTAERPPWRDHAGVILDDGAFQRAMRMVPGPEAEALWREFDALMQRHYAVWVATEPTAVD